MKPNRPIIDTSILNHSLQNIVKGTSLVLVGTILLYFFVFIAGVLIARNWTENYVGVLSLAYSIFTICVTISTMGFAKGLVYYISRSRSKNELNKLPDYIITSIVVSITISIILALSLFFSSEILAKKVFNEILIIEPLKIFAIALPFFVLNIIIASIFRGFEKIRPYVYFKYILEGALFPIFYGIIIFLDLDFIYVFYSYLLVGIIVTLCLVIYALKKLPKTFRYSIKSIFSPTSKDLIFYSIPLFAAAILHLITTWTSTLMLGTFKGTAEVGFYHVASPFAVFIAFPYGALAITFVPVFSGLYAKEKFDEIRSNYLILTKWICLLTLPIFLILFLFPELTLTVFVGSNYLPSADALRILSVIFIFMNFAGACGSALVAMGKSRFIMFSTLVGAVLGIILNYELIQIYGFIGAAIGISGTYFFITLANALKLFISYKIKPFNLNLLKPAVLLIVLIMPIYFFTRQILPYNFGSLVLLFLLFCGVLILSVLLTKSIDKEDLEMLVGLERKTGIKTTWLRNFLSKFV